MELIDWAYGGGGTVTGDMLLLSSIDELDEPAFLLLSGDMQSGSDRLEIRDAA